MRPFLIPAILALAVLGAVPCVVMARGSDLAKIDRVELAVADSGGASCPLEATLTAWAHTSGPGWSAS